MASDPAARHTGPRHTEPLPTEPLPTTEPRPAGRSDGDQPTPRPRRSLRWLAGAGLVTFGVVVLLVSVLLQMVPSLTNPFGEREVDRSQPVLLERIQDLSRYQAATGNFSVIIDLERDTPFIPSSVLGERTLFVAAGSVGAYVDFSGVGKGAITEKNRQVTIRLPHADLESVNLDHKRSYVYAEERGVLNRLGDFFSESPNNEQQLYLLAEKKIAAAADDSELRRQAEQNTRAMLVGMLGSLGYTQVTVRFEAPPA